MGDQIKQPANVGIVQPPNRSRDAGQRRRPRQQPERRDGEARRRPPPDDEHHQVDEYV